MRVESFQSFFNKHDLCKLAKFNLIWLLIFQIKHKIAYLL